MTILLTLLTLGFFSLLERVLLSTVQHRHGPGSQTADGLALLVADGIKLYSKWGTSDRIHTWYLLMSGLLFSISAWVLAATATSNLTSWIHLDGIDYLLLAIPAILLAAVVLLPTLTGGVYAHLSTLRALRGGLLADVAMETIIVGVATSQQAGASQLTTTISYWLLLLVPWWLASTITGGKPPFDLTEAESEMIAGVMTELAGGIFALALLTEGAELWTLLAYGVSLLACATTWIWLLTMSMIASYTGRVLLTRILVADLLLLVSTRLMFIPVSFIKEEDIYESTTY